MRTMARVFLCATALLASFCFAVPRPEHPRFRVTPLRHWRPEGQYKQKAPPTASALCLSLILVTGVFTRARQTWNNRRVPPPKCGLRSTENDSMLLMAEARRLRAEVAGLETEQLRAKEQIMACGGVELVKCSLVRRRPDFPQPVAVPTLKTPTTHVNPGIEAHWETEPPTAHVEPMEGFENEIPVMDHSVRLLATLPYLLPAIDAWRFFGVGVASEAWPALFLEWTSLATEVPQDLHYVLAALYPVVLFAMPLIAVRRCLPQLLRLNLNQAFLFSGILGLAFHLSSFCRWLGCLCADDAVYVPAAAEPPLLPCSHVLLPLMVACIVYSIYCTLCRGSSPDRIPYISAEARRSLGTSPAVLRSKSCSSFLERKARSHKILPGDRRDDVE
ncbi:unnamed protein product [Symbiodinium natans]|uniref:Protein TIC 20 n=1 Tax=Symbiodinium natans TaxID=878477 RepID=A0A812MR63_9DINO|nr:unnamed protein product [Symbiodinium natans]